eukprot:GFUD01061757.1.p1 GENE.GFUD01061757.1~~GFUD01061757.1.p1  ORF type:complete len:154 (-),score=32.23 GFUD01061757.1:2-463(-)
MADLKVVVSVLVCNYREALVYFFLAWIAGLMVISSILLGQYLSGKLTTSPTPYWSRAMTLHRGQDSEYSHLHGPGPPMLGSWNLSMAPNGEKCNPWSVNQMATYGDVDPHPLCSMKTRELDNSYPWVFYDTDSMDKSAVINSNINYRTQNISI